MKTTQYPQEFLSSNHYPDAHSMQEFYAAANLIPTSERADIALIRSHIMYHAGEKFAKRAFIAPSRGHSYKVDLYGDMKAKDMKIVKILDENDHRNGVTGLFSEEV